LYINCKWFDQGEQIDGCTDWDMGKI
jgi:hypothetical protein